ncbi:hypothetical protein BS47DRAFT_1373861 [Hydnum rufescens UP504]|uniref:ABC transporter domain-containing protein n=1 Tax=Hydnum rufescens UP504 TaxID=1448309 RepID=A0A9P6DQN5_9AGAM|nr:hypothetical protein BS47DRAFT_1373861 [Hydnum rufescens UP504]
MLSVLIHSATDGKCPPCFNCLLPAFTCGQFGECNPYDGQCKCPPGFGGIDCLTPQCGSLADGTHRYPRPDGEECGCKDGWGGINCNGENRTVLCSLPVCQLDNACSRFPISGMAAPFDSEVEQNMTCYKGGDTVIHNYQMCDITNRKILDMLPGRPPQVTFSCNRADETCGFEFWIGKVESFYCALDTCTTSIDVGYDGNITSYKCDHIKCSCIPGKMLCGEADSIDISEFLTDNIKGPASFSCTTGSGCKFEEPEMNQLINDIFGDRYITLDCESGECLHYTQVPGYHKPERPRTSQWVALSAAGAGLIFIIASACEKIPFIRHISRKQKRAVVLGTRSSMVDMSRMVHSESTLTVYETVLYSALLRLPRDMSFEAKKFRTLETMHELGILGIKDSRIGDTGKRSISGGEKRRVSIACELVTSPSILFLDEPTSGLDSFNAHNVVESLVSLARDYNRTVVFTIHQPRSNIVAMFDHLVLLAKGKLIYSGEVSKCHDYFVRIGHPCPPGFNIADFLIDLTMQIETTSPGPSGTPLEREVSDDGRHFVDEEQALPRTSSSQTPSHPSGSSHSQVNADLDVPRSRTRPSSIADSISAVTKNVGNGAGNYIKRKTSQLLDAISSGSTKGNGGSTMSPQLAALVQAYYDSDIASAIREDINVIRQRPEQTGEPEATQTRDITEESSNLRGRRRASYATQFRILSGRAFKNLYRNPALLSAHYISSIAIAVICGFLFQNVTNDIPGFQNRLGVFFFTLALFGFSCLSSLSLFANERVLFIRERANGYYSSFTYFASKVLFDIMPLRVVPPLVFGGIIYSLIGLVPTVAAFWKFQLTLVLFNLTTAGLVFFISVAFADTSVGTLVGTLIMLFNLLFAGLLINRDTVSAAVRWVHNISFYHAAFEALAVNELRYLQLKETKLILISMKYGVELDVPAATILSMFGSAHSPHCMEGLTLVPQAFWFPDIALLGILFVLTLAASYIVLHFFVREKR